MQLLCPCCSKGPFFRHSIGHHIKSCARIHGSRLHKFACPVCHEEMMSEDLGKHVRVCAAQSSKPQRSSSESLLKEFPGKVVELLPCKFCSRKFAAARLGKHERVCQKKQATPVRSKFNSAEKRRPDVLRQSSSSASILGASTTMHRSGSMSMLENYRGRRKVNAAPKPIGASLQREFSKVNIVQSNVASVGNPLRPDPRRYLF